MPRVGVMHVAVDREDLVVVEDLFRRWDRGEGPRDVLVDQPYDGPREDPLRVILLGGGVELAPGGRDGLLLSLEPGLEDLVGPELQPARGGVVGVTGGREPQRFRREEHAELHSVGHPEGLGRREGLEARRPTDVAHHRLLWNLGSGCGRLGGAPQQERAQQERAQETERSAPPQHVRGEHRVSGALGTGHRERAKRLFRRGANRHEGGGGGVPDSPRRPHMSPSKPAGSRGFLG